MSIMQPSSKVRVRCPNRKCKMSVYGTAAEVASWQGADGLCPKCGTDMSRVKAENLILEGVQR